MVDSRNVRPRYYPIHTTRPFRSLRFKAEKWRKRNTARQLALCLSARSAGLWRRRRRSTADSNDRGPQSRGPCGDRGRVSGKSMEHRAHFHRHTACRRRVHLRLEKPDEPENRLTGSRRRSLRKCVFTFAKNGRVSHETKNLASHEDEIRDELKRLLGELEGNSDAFRKALSDDSGGLLEMDDETARELEARGYL